MSDPLQPIRSGTHLGTYLHQVTTSTNQGLPPDSKSTLSSAAAPSTTSTTVSQISKETLGKHFRDEKTPPDVPKKKIKTAVNIKLEDQPFNNPYEQSPQGPSITPYGNPFQHSGFPSNTAYHLSNIAAAANQPVLTTHYPIGQFNPQPAQWDSLENPAPSPFPPPLVEAESNMHTYYPEQRMIPVGIPLENHRPYPPSYPSPLQQMPTFPQDATINLSNQCIPYLTQVPSATFMANFQLGDRDGRAAAQENRKQMKPATPSNAPRPFTANRASCSIREEKRLSFGTIPDRCYSIIPSKLSDFLTSVPLRDREDSLLEILNTPGTANLSAKRSAIVTGPRGCGKTQLAENVAKRILQGIPCFSNTTIYIMDARMFIRAQSSLEWMFHILKSNSSDRKIVIIDYMEALISSYENAWGLEGLLHDSSGVQILGIISQIDYQEISTKYKVFDEKYFSLVQMKEMDKATTLDVLKLKFEGMIAPNILEYIVHEADLDFLKFSNPAKSITFLNSCVGAFGLQEKHEEFSRQFVDEMIDKKRRQIQEAGLPL